MRLIVSAACVGLAVAWLSCVSVIARVIGGYKWLEHTGHARPVTMVVLMAILCIALAGALIFLRRVPKLLSVGVGALAGLHLFNVVGFFLLTGPYGHVPLFLLKPFHFVAITLPTTTRFVGMPPSTASFFILPIATLVVLLAAVAVSRGADSRRREALTAQVASS